ncbi:hypothetical protein [Micromonospora globbae]|uniref:hypothetical protein n=1 Tax=Micromonospora globbae TaxID=1894969 RepID=UPI00342C8487
MQPDRGMKSRNPAIAATSQVDPGLKYAAFIEAVAATPFFVGSAWFAHYDQAVTNKSGSTESFNMVLGNQQDQPYHDMTTIMRETNRKLEEIHL